MPVAAGDVVEVARFFVDIERLEKPAFSVVEVAAFLSDDAELVIGVGGVVEVAGFFVDIERLEKPVFSRVEVAACLSEGA